MKHGIICPFCHTVFEDLRVPLTAAIDCPACAESVEPSAVSEQTPEWIDQQVAAGKAQRLPESDDKRVDVGFVPNLRLKDNVFQAIAIFVHVVLGAVVGGFLAGVEDIVPGVLAGAFAGLVIGLFISGIWLMFYRMYRH